MTIQKLSKLKMFVMAQKQKTECKGFVVKFSNWSENVKRRAPHSAPNV